MSLLLDHGHSHARFYPIGMVWEEASIVVDRMNQEDASRTVLFNLAYTGAKSKKGAKILQKALKELSGG